MIGLSIGLSICYLAFLYVNFELNHDTAPAQADQIYRLVTDEKKADGINYESASGAIGPALAAEFPEVKNYVRVFLDDYIIQKEEHNYGTVPLAYADSSLFSVFSFPLIAGNPQTVFRAPFDMVVSETAAKKYFGSTDCLGETLLLNGNQRATVTGVMKDIPSTSHFKREIILSLSSLIGTRDDSSWLTNWNRYGFNTYLLVEKGSSIQQLTSKLPDFINRHNPQKEISQVLQLEPLKEVYFKGKPRGSKAGSTDHGNINHVYAFSVIAILVLFIACFNFINLTTAFSLQRTKEIGVRKVMGASKRQLIIQFLIDSVVVCWIASIIAIAMSILLMPLFVRLTGSNLGINLKEQLTAIGITFLFTLIIGLLSGIYPAFLLSSFKSSDSLKGTALSSLKGYMVRKTLIVLQFSIAIVLIIVTTFIYQQVDFMKNKDLGFKKDHMLVIDFQYDQRILDHMDAVKEQLKQLSGVSKASFASYIPGKPNRKFPTEIEDVNSNKQEFQSDAYFVDEDFINQYQIKLLAGRNFSKNFNDDKKSMIINETTSKMLGYQKPENAIGRKFSQKTKGGDGEIIGVIKDFHFQSMTGEIQPLTLRMSSGFFTFLTLSISGAHSSETIKTIEKEFTEFAPGLPFSYFFSDDAYNSLYKAEERFQSVFTYLAGIAIFISCLGLFGLSTFGMTQRRKEVGVRKVLGASVAGLVQLLSTEFIKLVFISFLVALPIAWMVTYQWLLTFAYRIDISLWVFLFGGGMAVIIAFITISFQTLKAALANPIKSLRIE